MLELAADCSIVVIFARVRSLILCPLSFMYRAASLVTLRLLIIPISSVAMRLEPVTSSYVV